MIVLKDVEAGSTWFQSVLGLQSAHGGPHYEMLMHDGELVLQLHHWDIEDHPLFGDPDGPTGNGSLLWFATDDWDALLSRVEKTRTTVLEGPLFNQNASHNEVWLEGPDGYVVVVNGPRHP